MDSPRPTLTVVGLGPSGPDLLGDPARQSLVRADAVFLRTREHPSAAEVAALRPDLVTFDRHYDEAPTFEEVYRRIVDDLVAEVARRAPAGESVVYAVPGSPLVAERTVELLRSDRRVAIEVVPALSFLDLAWDRLGLDPVAAGVRLVDGTRFAEEAAGETGPLLVAQCWSNEVLSAVKLAVESDEGSTATILFHLGLPDERVVEVPWEDLDRALEADHLTSLFVPRLAAPVAHELVALDELVRTLRTECPWDREQTHASLRRHLVEETYEVLDAIDGLESGGEAAATHLEEELGDLLYQVFFHARLASEEGWFTMADVARGLHDKLVARHPHVFGEVEAADAAAVMANWEQLKAVEKGRTSVTDGVPTALPALMLASKLQSRAAAAGIGLPGGNDRPGSWDELFSAPDDAADEWFGWLLFTVVDVARRRGVDAEEALRAAAMRFRDEVVADERATADEQSDRPAAGDSPGEVGSGE